MNKTTSRGLVASDNSRLDSTLNMLSLLKIAVSPDDRAALDRAYMVAIRAWSQTRELGYDETITAL